MLKSFMASLSFIVLVALSVLLIAPEKAATQESIQPEVRRLTPEAIQKLIPSESKPIPVSKEPSFIAKRFKPMHYAQPLPTGIFHSGVFSITNSYYFENTAQVIAPGANAACTNARVVVSTGSDGSGSFLRDLYDITGELNFNAPVTQSTFPLAAEHEAGTDNLLLKLKDGSLIAIRMSVTWEPVIPKPVWWDQVVIQNHPNGSRVCAIVWKSTDCGTTWTRISVIDPINFDEGRYAVPRPIEANCPDGCYGGWDRIEAYADPWNGNIYFSTVAVGGPIIDYTTGTELEPAAATHFIILSTDGGYTWKKIHDFYAWTPIVMTSTPNGRLYLYSSIDTIPTLFYSLLGSQPLTFSDPKPINYWVEQNGIRTPIPAGADTIYGKLVYKATNSISRISTDITSSRVRLSYQWIDGNGRTAVAVVNVDVPDDIKDPVVTPVSTFHAMNPSNSILASSFVDPDPIGATVNGTNTSLLYWVEGSTDPKQAAYVRYSIFRGEAGGTAPVTLAGPYKPTVSVAHYMYSGSFFPSNGSLNYLAQWVQQDGIRANIVTLPYDLNVLAAEGKVTMLRVHDAGSGGYGPPADNIDVEVVIALDSEPNKAFGFQLRNDAKEVVRHGMLDRLRDAFNHNRRVRIDYYQVPGLNNCRILRVMNIP